jgi:hypothetical protein
MVTEKKSVCITCTHTCTLICIHHSKLYTRTLSKTIKQVGFITAIPAGMRAWDQRFSAVEINFLCVHKKLRSKRLAPVPGPPPPPPPPILIRSSRGDVALVCVSVCVCVCVCV